MTDLNLTPLERAARAMYDNVQPDWEWHDPEAEPMRKLYRDNVRVAMMAIMEPSEAMIGKGNARMEGSDCLAVWQTMLAAMLQGQ